MKGGSKTSVRTIDATIFNAHRAMSRYHLERVRSYLDADLLKNAGVALESAIVHYESASMSIARAQDRDVPPNLQENAQKAMLIAESLKKDSREYKQPSSYFTACNQQFLTISASIIPKKHP